MTDLTPIIEALFLLLAGIVTVFVIPVLKEKFGVSRFNEIQMWVSVAVNAAEQLFNQSGMGEQKKQYVLDFLQDKGYFIDAEKIDALIESAVYKLKGGE